PASPGNEWAIGSRRTQTGQVDSHELLLAGNRPTPLRLPLEQVPAGPAPATAARRSSRGRAGDRLRHRAEPSVLPRTGPHAHGGRSEPRNAPAGAEADQAAGHRG